MSLADVVSSGILTVYSDVSSTMAGVMVNLCFVPSTVTLVRLSGLIFLLFLNHSTFWLGLDSSHSRVTDSSAGQVVSLRGWVKVTLGSVGGTRSGSHQGSKVMDTIHCLDIEGACYKLIGTHLKDNSYEHGSSSNVL